MAREPLEIGTFGDIYHSAQVDGTWMPLREVPDGAEPTNYKAAARYRAADGHTRQMERVGPTSKKAEANLKKALIERLNANGTILTGDSRFGEVAKVWMAGVERRRAATTVDRYRGRLDNHVIPALGRLFIRECTPGRLKQAIDAMERTGLEAGTLRGIRTVISGVLQEAVDLELVDKNPVRNMSRITSSGRRKKKVSYNAQQLVDFLAKVDADKTARRGDLCDVIRFLFGTGARFGEALALRWRDLNLTDEPVDVEDEDGDFVQIPAHGVWFNGNLVGVRGRGIVRHGGKTESSRGTVVLPEFLVMLLQFRQPADAGPDTPVFPSSVGGWRHPSNVQRSVRRLRERIGYPTFTTHVGRRTVATALDRAGHTAREVAAILRHARPSMTQDVYMAKDTANPAAAAALDRFHGAA